MTTTATIEETIAAISTPPGEGGIGIVRLSGPEAVPIACSVFVSSSGRDPGTGRGRVFHGEIRDEATVIDEVLLHVMRAPHSYTCEDVVEINAHGGAVPLNTILELVLGRGARLAGPGEFTRRAFLNGRIDLLQAESVIDRIQARTRAGLQAAAASASGELSRCIHEFTETLKDAKALIEAEVDFVEQDVPALVTPSLRKQLEATLSQMNELLRTADAGRLYREGASVAIAGRPNAGKSSLFNAMLRDHRAIVTAHPGTTRDTLEETVNLRGIPLRLTDMAGLRETEDEVEQLGVDAARRAISQSAIVLFVVDASVPWSAVDAELSAEILALGVPVLLALNKIDLGAAVATPGEFTRTLRISAKTGAGLVGLEDALHQLLSGGVEVAPDQGTLTRLHQKESLRRACEALARLLEGFDASPEFLAIDLDEALRALGEITGETTPDDVLERIFASFCIGK